MTWLISIGFMIGWIVAGILWVHLIIVQHDLHELLKAYDARKEHMDTALMLACQRIADGPQQYHEANTADGWRDVFVEAAYSGETPQQVIANRMEQSS